MQFCYMQVPVTDKNGRLQGLWLHEVTVLSALRMCDIKCLQGKRHQSVTGRVFYKEHVCFSTTASIFLHFCQPAIAEAASLCLATSNHIATIMEVGKAG